MSDSKLEVQALKARNERLRRGLRYYANQQHMMQGDWENPSGEPINIECCGDEATVENGGVARAVLADNLDWPPDDIVLKPIEGETY